VQRRLAARCGRRPGLAASTFVRSEVEHRAWLRTLPWGSSGVAAPVLWPCTFAALSQRATGPRSELNGALLVTRRNDEWHTWSKGECSGQWRGQREQHQEVRLERSELGHDTLIPDLHAERPSGEGATNHRSRRCCAPWPRWLRTSRPCAWLLATLPSCAAELRGASRADKPCWQAVLACRPGRPVRGRSTWTS
jgi:hypothetical protein